MSAKWKQFTKEQIELIVKESKSFREMAVKLGYSPDGGSSIATMKKVIEEYQIDTSHFLGQGWNKDNFDYDRFQNGKAIKAARALDTIVALRTHKCENCGLETWLDKKIPLEVHHLDGNHLNNELENLQLLCPNCHAFTENYRGKNINVVKGSVSDEAFIKALKENSSIRKALLSLGLTGAGANYERAYRLVSENNIEHLKKK